MLNILFGSWDNNDDNFISNMDGFFNIMYEDEWINNEFSKEVIRVIDKSEVIGNKVIDSPFLGIISPEKLSGGTKLLISMYMEGDNFIYEGTNCGPNCSDYILRISKERDITMTRRYMIKFSSKDFEVRILNDNSIVRNNEELINKYIEFRDETYI